MNSRNIFTQEHLDKIMNSAIEKKSAKKDLLLKKQIMNVHNKYQINPTFKKYLPYSLNYKRVEKLALVLLASLFFHQPSEAASAVRTTSSAKPKTSQTSKIRQQRIAAINNIRRTEANTGAGCIDCLESRAPQSESALQKYLSQLPAVKAGHFNVANIAVYEDRRLLTVNLIQKMKRGDTLSLEEKAVFDALPKVGFFACPDGLGVNGTLIKKPGTNEDAILVSKHSFIENGVPLCDLSKVAYYPNFSLYDGGKVTDFIKTKVLTDGKMPLNIETQDDINGDFLTFTLNKNISDERLPDGRIRGHMKFDANPNNQVSSYIIIGQNSNFNKRSHFYESCSGSRASFASSKYLFHDCSTSYGSSSSVLTRLIDGELMLSGLHRGEFSQSEGNASAAQNNIKENLRERPKDIRELNRAIPVETILNYFNSNLNSSSISI